MIRVFKAMMIDTLRYLRSRFLFWLVLALSTLAAILLFATYSFTPEGIQILGFKPIENPMLAKGTPGRDMFVAGLFNGFYVKFWLGWGAMILALVSTASLIPDFISDGAIELTQSKPIRRSTLFFFKFLSGLGFVVAQLTIGIGLAYLIIGIRFDLWLHTSLLAIPLLTLQFVYLYAISATIAVITRSTIASLLGTILIWFIIFLLQFVANNIHKTHETFLTQANQVQTRVVTLTERIETGGEDPTASQTRKMESLLREKGGIIESADSLYPWLKNFKRAELAIPKTGDLQKYLAKKVDAPVTNEFMGLFFNISDDAVRPSTISKEEMEDANAAEIAAIKAVRNLSITESILSSLAVVGLLLWFSMWRFSRRDF
ncbi:MAG: ABC transporter permease subunit [Phycisphaerales bacterium]|nr:ABC transporter permease subunit [Phycisphaerales bacterium]